MLHLSVQAQHSSFSFRNISINQGLSQSSVVDITTDKAGFLWFATQDGLNRYDGKQFVIFKKNFDDITTPTGSKTGKIIYGNTNNELWLITSGGKLERMNLYNHTFTTVTTLGDQKIKLPPVSCLLEDNYSNVWIGTENNGLFIYNLLSNKIENYTSTSASPLTSNYIQAIYNDKQHNNWILTDNGITLLNIKNKINKKFLRGISCSAINGDKKNNLWLGSFGKGLYIKTAADTTFHAFTGFNVLNKLPANLVVETVMADQSDRIWVGTYGNGLYIINPTDSSIKHLLYDKRNPFSLGYNDVLSIKHDKNGGIWIGTDGGGVSYYNQRLNNFTLYSPSNLPENISIEQVRSITTGNDGGIWIGTSNNGLSYINPEKNIYESFHFSRYWNDISNYDRIVSLFAAIDGDVCIGTQGNGLIIIDSKTKKVKKHFHPQANAALKIPDHTIWCIHPGVDNKIWIGTRHAGLCLIDKEKGLIKNYVHQPDNSNSPAENNIRTITTINDSMLCIGYEKKGIQFFNVKQEKFYSTAGLKKLDSIETTVKSVYYQNPLIWVGTLGQGLMAYNYSNQQIHFITEAHGLPNNTVYGILPDTLGGLWLSTNKGLCRFSPPADLKNANALHFNLFTVEDGLQSNEFNTGAYHRSSNGLLFFGGINGLNMFDPLKLIRDEQPINTVIINATIDNKPWTGDTNITYKKTLHLTHQNNSIAFDFAALDYVSPGKFNYYYQLTNYDKDWINAGNRNYAAYTNLPHGKYLFKVKASNSMTNTHDQITTLAIVIAPPFWKTWWFILLCILAISAILYSLYRYRINQLIALHKVRNRIATDLHDDIGSTLTNISILSELSKKNIPKQHEANVFLNRISEEVYSSGQALDDIVWSINTSNDTLEQTVARMRRYAAEVFDGANITYTLQMDEQFAQHKLNMEQRRDCFLIFKEAVNNIYKHANAKNVNIKVWIERNHLHMKITDDGKGFDASLATNRNGIKNMHSRMQKWKGKLSIQSAKGTGTTTEVNLPLH